MSIQKLGMPKWGLSMTEGKVLEWLVEEGSEIAVGDEIAEVETEKITGAVESPAAGVLRRHVAAPGDVIAVGGLLGVIAPADVPDSEIDAFVEEFQASFVPGEAEEDAGGPSAETVDTPAGPVRVLVAGEGDEVLVLLHGFGGDAENWRFNLDSLADGRTVLAIDLPGHGSSTKAVSDPGALVTAVTDVLDARGHERAHLAGHSMGGLVAAELALSAPERVASLTLVAPMGFGKEINADYIEGFIAARTRRELKPVLQLLFADADLVTRQLVDEVLRYKRLDGVEDALRTLQAGLFDEGDQPRVLAAELDNKGVPLLLIWGERDQVIPAAHAQAAPQGTRVQILPDAGHSPHMEAAGEVNRLVADHLTKAPV
jgi:pyruvate dehydrogenase E2 component (dihydrolipoamide acetyltransferase)